MGLTPVEKSSVSVQLTCRSHPEPLILKKFPQDRVVIEQGIRINQPLRLIARIFKNSTVIGEARQSKIGQTRLTRAQHLSWTSQTKIHFSNLKSIR